MLLSLNWLRDFVDLPDELDPQRLAERLTMVTCEVEGIERVRVEADGLLVAEVLTCKAIAGTRDLWCVELDAGGKRLTTVSAAPDLAVGKKLIYAPPGATLPHIGKVGRTEVASRQSEGMIVPGEAIGIEQAAQQAIFLPPSTAVGSSIDARELEDWIIEIDNKTITHRPDLWGHYGLAREIAAFAGVTLKPYTEFIVPVEQLQDASLPEIPIVIDDADKCPRYTGLMIDGLAPQPAPLLMQARLSHVGIRPIDLIVDLTNYIMAEIGQPMHAFDGEKVACIEVAVAKPGDRFTTLDDVERAMPVGALMIQSGRRNVALAGIMGGADSEVTDRTTRVLLESANFDAPTIRRCAAALGHRTEASARFEKALDPNNTVLSIARFVKLAEQELPDLKLAGRLSDAYPKPLQPVSIDVDLAFVNRLMGRDVEPSRVEQILGALAFEVTQAGEGKLRVQSPSFRATRDVTIEADVIEEIARFVGYENIDPQLPAVRLRRFEPNALHRLERRSLEVLCRSEGFAEIQSFLWDDESWLAALGCDPGQRIGVRNPPAAGTDKLRRTLLPGLLAAVERNRHFLDDFSLLELGSVFLPKGIEGCKQETEFKHLALACVLRGGRKTEDRCVDRVRQAIESWARHALNRPVEFALPDDEARLVWEHPHKRAVVTVSQRRVGRVTAVPEALKTRVHEHLGRWSIALAELRLDALLDLPAVEVKLRPVSAYPQVQLDFSVLAATETSFVQIRQRLETFEHPLLRRVTFLDSYQGKPLPQGKRSLTLRAWIGHEQHTLTDQDRRHFEQAFTQFLARNDLPLRA